MTEMRRRGALAAALAMLALVSGWSCSIGHKSDATTGASPRRAHGEHARTSGAAASTSAARRVASGQELGALWLEISRELDPALAASRAVMLGQRDPNGKSCVRQFAPGETDDGPKAPRAGDANGGPGLRILQAYYWDHTAPTPVADFEWHQKDFRRMLEGMLADSRSAGAKVTAVAERARRLSEELQHWGRWDDRFAPPAMSLRDDGWPSLCEARLATAIGDRELDEARRWAAELASTLTALEDLHRWLDFLLENQLASLDFQALNRDAFEENQNRFLPRDAKADRQSDKERYVSPAVISRFASGSVAIAHISNLFEVERQAEAMFRQPKAWLAAADAAECIRPHDPLARGWEGDASIALSPDVRASFLALRAKLGPANRQLWERAATMPYEHTYLANQLWRGQEAGVLEAMGVVLERFDKRRPTGATVEDLMDVLMYRAGLGMSGLEWGDRYDPRLMKAAAKIEAKNRWEALVAAREFQYDVYGGSQNYKGLVLSLRRALVIGKMDCIRGSDMIAAVYRDAGWAGLLSVRWCRGTSGHTIAAVRLEDGGVVTVDSLFAPGSHEGSWPESYRTGHRDLDCAELNGRGLDNGVWLEGYIVRGPNAGTLVKAAVPYLKGYEKAKTQRLGSADRGNQQ